ncbi:MAG: VanZ family protein [Bacteroidota bacterium]
MADRKYFRFVSCVPLIVLSIVIFTLSHMSRPPMPESGYEFEDKVLHCVAYFAYGMTVLLALMVNFPKVSFSKLAMLTLIIGGLFGFSDEYHQSFVPNRDSGIEDWYADITGIAMSLVTAIPLRKLTGIPRFGFKEEVVEEETV